LLIRGPSWSHVAVAKATYLYSCQLTSIILIATVYPSTATETQVTVGTTSTIQVVDGSAVSRGTDVGESSSMRDRIALGVGIGFGVPTTIAAIITCLRRK
jgi:hypothetical protein